LTFDPIKFSKESIKTKTIVKISSKKQGSRSVATKKCCNEIPIYNRLLVI